jgi:hypothetical protein
MARGPERCIVAKGMNRRAADRAAAGAGSPHVLEISAQRTDQGGVASVQCQCRRRLAQPWLGTTPQ